MFIIVAHYRISNETPLRITRYHFQFNLVLLLPVISMDSGLGSSHYHQSSAESVPEYGHLHMLWITGQMPPRDDEVSI